MNTQRGSHKNILVDRFSIFGSVRCDAATLHKVLPLATDDDAHEFILLNVLLLLVGLT
jgi:hypothetical protein